MIPNAILPADETNVLRLVNMLGVGRENAIRADVLQERLGLPRQRTAESVRALVKAAIEEHHICIGSGAKGYWLIANEGELTDALANLDNRMSGIRARADGMREAWFVRNGERVAADPGGEA